MSNFHYLIPPLSNLFYRVHLRLWPLSYDHSLLLLNCWHPIDPKCCHKIFVDHIICRLIMLQKHIEMDKNLNYEQFLIYL